MREEENHKRIWRDYRTKGGSRPVRDFLRSLPDEDRAAIFTEMKSVAEQGVVAARHLHEDIYEVRASYNTKIYRILFAREGHYKHILLSLEGFHKKTEEIPPHEIRLAEKRLADWRSRATPNKQGN